MKLILMETIMRLTFIIAITLAASFTPHLADARESTAAAPCSAEINKNSNALLEHLLRDDQADRTSFATFDINAALQKDAERRRTVSQMIASGQVRTGADYCRAAFVFQHGSTSSDYLLAHSLAIAAMAQGSRGASWIAAASLDRYLQSIGKPQIYGTQYYSEGGGEFTQEPFDRGLVKDSLRAVIGVPDLKTQEQSRQSQSEEIGRHPIKVPKK